LRTKSPQVCIASTGLNNAAIDPPITDDLYLQNIDRCLALLQPVCEQVIWISITATVKTQEVKQENCKLKWWNDILFDLIQTQNYENVYVVDVWEKTMHTDHVGSSLVLDKHLFPGSTLHFANGKSRVISIRLKPNENLIVYLDTHLYSGSKYFVFGLWR
jgi:hypothetical protein